MPGEVYLLSLLPIGGMVVFLIVAVVLAARHSAANDASPVLTVNVRLAKKKKIFHGGRYHHTELLFFFLTDDGELLDFNVPNSLDFDFYNEGDTGLLTYQ